MAQGDTTGDDATGDREGSEIPQAAGGEASGSTRGPATRVDPHVKVLDDRVVSRAKARGIDVLVYAPHFERLPAIEERAAAYTDDDLLVVPAREAFTGSWRSRKHVLALGLDEPVPDFVTLAGAMAEFERQDATVLVPHPEFLNVSLTADDVRRYRDRVAGVEVYNPKHLPPHDRAAQELARETGLPGFGSSYAHLPGTVGEVWTTFDGAITDESDLLAALEGTAPRKIQHRPGARHRVQCVAEFAHLGWENTGKKLAGFAAGPKATNPYHPAYEGRFDDVAVYPEAVHRREPGSVREWVGAWIGGRSGD